ncbi:MAG: N-acetylmuramoyl-L-alanine amidase, partial [Coriobacteriia bacterium]|nr:N-acetylmuramoyl-L-alanine amidase [Coriobacteriia bacterium]
YFVDDGSIWQVVLDRDISWHAGATYYYSDARNTNSIGIEMCCVSSGGKLDISPRTEANTIELVKMLMDRYNIEESNVIRHYDATRKICPAPHVNVPKRWTDFKAALKNSSPVTPPKPPEPPQTGAYPSLRVGSKGENVKALQCLLNFQNGNSALLIDGDFGAITDRAVKAFQRQRGLVIDGVAGAITLSTLIASVRLGSNNFAVRAAQHLLSKFEPIVIDGFFGSVTDSIVKTYQGKMGLVADGWVGQITWQSLFANNAYPVAPPVKPPQKLGYRLLPKDAPIKDADSSDQLGFFEDLTQARLARDKANQAVQPYALYDQSGKEVV